MNEAVHLVYLSLASGGAGGVLFSSTKPPCHACLSAADGQEVRRELSVKDKILCMMSSIMHEPYGKQELQKCAIQSVAYGSTLMSSPHGGHI